ncbi:MAG TPA: 6-phosphogluconolactonase [Candidatus Binatia bacterium]|nr:6-phosphogluconolactonase [Candidatus Binatia bacterium]
MNVFKFDSEEAWVEGVATFWRDRLCNNPRLRMCLPSGHTPNKIFAAMGEAVKARQLSFREAEIFCLDEFGGLAPDDPGKCANMLKHYLLSHIDLPERQFHWLDIDAPDLTKVCLEYDNAIEPGFDLTLLGLGLNGHLGMNEPGTTADSPTRRVDLAPGTTASSAKYLTHSKLPTWGLAVGLKQLLGSKEVWLLVNGSAKAEIVRRTVKSSIGEDVPATLLREHRNSFLMADADAAAEI